MRTVVSRATRTLMSGGGAVLSGATRIVAAARPAAKPLHPKGKVVLARLHRRGARPPTGVAWLDEAGEEEVLVRRSRAVGLPGALPDVYGLALRVPVLGDHHGDLLFATTGLGPLGRFVLHPTWSPAGQPMTTLLPYAGPEGAVMLAAVPRAEDRFDLACASLRTPWRMFAELTLLAEDGPDPLLSFDPVRNTVPGLDNYGWVRRLREPAYVVARRTRRED